uniref:Uncharacterized protein n=1 Tax=Euplotes harpa TaxID=151035 RepID=A0A7S3N432_9SPIT|mmetsp:Transcript_19225/g.22242  ORF Transcript_19225/g.22242 Transcript_19225/m.22242 type:complete len:459 (+) Transcript_19225:1446-2822(+)
MTGFDFEDSKKNSMHKQPILIDNFEDYMFDADDLGKHRDFGRGDSSSFDEETPLGGITMNERKKRKKRRKQKKKKDPYNPKIRQLEEIYDNKNLRNTSVKGDTSQFGGEFTSKNTLRSRKNITSLVREKTVKLSDSISPRGKIELNSPILSPNTNKMANTNDNWMGGNKKKMNLKTQNTLKSEQNKIKSKKKSDKGLNFYNQSAMAVSPNLGVNPSLTKSTDTLFKDKKTNADAHRGELIKKNNFLRASLNAGGKLQMNSNASANSSNGFKNAKKSPKKSNDRGRSMNRNDLVLNTTALKEEFGKSKKKLPRRRFSKSPAVFKIDGESPYAEYLPALYREYRPKEKKLKRQNSNVSLNDFFKKLDRAYSDVGSVGIRSRDGSRDGKSLRRKGSNNKSLLKMNTFKSDSSVSSYHKQKSIRSNSSKVTKNKKKTSSVNDDSFLKLAELVKARVTKAKNQ